MPSMKGSFSGSITNQSTILLSDQPEHVMSLGEVHGTQKASDPKWDGSRLTYWGVTDLVGAQGNQRGYYDNDHGNAGHEWGSFEGKVTVAGGQMSVEGTWKITGGSGEFRGISGGGTFRTKATSPTTLEASWEGAYELAKAQAG
jgi:hypothetical protein